MNKFAWWIVTIVLSSAAGIVAVFIGGSLSSCKPAEEPIKVNPVSADCLLDRDSEQNKCVRLDAGYTERQNCLDLIRLKHDCTKDGGS